MAWTYAPQILAVLLAQRVGRPVKLLFGQRESFFYGGNIDSAIHYFKVGAKKDGTITAVQIKGVFGARVVGYRALADGVILGVGPELHAVPGAPAAPLPRRPAAHRLLRQQRQPLELREKVGGK